MAANDRETLDGFHLLTRTEGIIPALESAHAIAYAKTLAAQMKRDELIIINLSGRGDKDMQTVAEQEGMEL